MDVPGGDIDAPLKDTPLYEEEMEALAPSYLENSSGGVTHDPWDTSSGRDGVTRSYLPANFLDSDGTSSHDTFETTSDADVANVHDPFENISCDGGQTSTRPELCETGDGIRVDSRNKAIDDDTAAHLEETVSDANILLARETAGDGDTDKLVTNAPSASCPPDDDFVHGIAVPTIIENAVINTLSVPNKVLASAEAVSSCDMVSRDASIVAPSADVKPATSAASLDVRTTAAFAVVARVAPSSNSVDCAKDMLLSSSGREDGLDGPIGGCRKEITSVGMTAAAIAYERTEDLRESFLGSTAVVAQSSHGGGDGRSARPGAGTKSRQNQTTKSSTIGCSSPIQGVDGETVACTTSEPQQLHGHSGLAKLKQSSRSSSGGTIDRLFEVQGTEDDAVKEESGDKLTSTLESFGDSGVPACDSETRKAAAGAAEGVGGSGMGNTPVLPIRTPQRCPPAHVQEHTPDYLEEHAPDTMIPTSQPSKRSNTGAKSVTGRATSGKDRGVRAPEGTTPQGKLSASKQRFVDVAASPMYAHDTLHGKTRKRSDFDNKNTSGAVIEQRAVNTGSDSILPLPNDSITASSVSRKGGTTTTPERVATATHPSRLYSKGCFNTSTSSLRTTPVNPTMSSKTARAQKAPKRRNSTSAARNESSTKKSKEVGAAVCAEEGGSAAAKALSKQEVGTDSSSGEEIDVGLDFTPAAPLVDDGDDSCADHANAAQKDPDDHKVGGVLQEAIGIKKRVQGPIPPEQNIRRPIETDSRCVKTGGCTLSGLLAGINANSSPGTVNAEPPALLPLLVPPLLQYEDNETDSRRPARETLARVSKEVDLREIPDVGGRSESDTELVLSDSPAAGDFGGSFPETASAAVLASGVAGSCEEQRRHPGSPCDELTFIFEQQRGPEKGEDQLVSRAQSDGVYIAPGGAGTRTYDAVACTLAEAKEGNKVGPCMAVGYQRNAAASAAQEGGRGDAVCPVVKSTMSEPVANDALLPSLPAAAVSDGELPFILTNVCDDDDDGAGLVRHGGGVVSVHGVAFEVEKREGHGERALVDDVEDDDSRGDGQERKENDLVGVDDGLQEQGQEHLERESASTLAYDGSAAAGGYQDKQEDNTAVVDGSAALCGVEKHMEGGEGAEQWQEHKDAVVGSSCKDKAGQSRTAAYANSVVEEQFPDAGDEQARASCAGLAAPMAYLEAGAAATDTIVTADSGVLEEVPVRSDSCSSIESTFSVGSEFTESQTPDSVETVSFGQEAVTDATSVSTATSESAAALGGLGKTIKCVGRWAKSQDRWAIVRFAFFSLLLAFWFRLDAPTKSVTVGTTSRFSRRFVVPPAMGPPASGRTVIY
ncbi:unnamed protein product [Sphacelaria rigidula]